LLHLMALALLAPLPLESVIQVGVSQRDKVAMIVSEISWKARV
jgi:hypothetical protein